jgi:Uma2 family endonuclease
VIEVLSPSNTVDEISDKMFICMSNGCNSFWIVDPKRQLVSVTQGAVTTHYGVQAMIVILSPAIEVEVAEIF